MLLAIYAWLALKEHISRSTFSKIPNKAPLPPNLNLLEIHQQLKKLVYKADPFGGALDFYNHPEYMQYCLNNSIELQHCDCDDFAVYAYALARANFIPKIYTLVVEDMFKDGSKNHVICVVKSQNQFILLDNVTASLPEPLSFASLEEIKKYFESAFGTTYRYMIDSKYPF